MHYGPLDDGDTRIGPGLGQPPAPAPVRRRRRWPYFAAAVVVVLVSGGAGAWWLTADHSDAPKTTIVTGALLLKGAFGGGPCAGSDGYDDIAAGTQVVVYDQAGTTIAAGVLEAGTPGGFISDTLYAQCRFGFHVNAVPVAKFYAVEVSHRGKVTYSDEQVSAGEITLTLGS
jgi:hypothetical protein